MLGAKGIQMAENKMAEVAKLFGKKLGEEFCVKSHHTEGNCIGAFTKYGFECQNYTNKENQAVFILLVTGKAVIVDEGGTTWRR